MSRPTHVGDVVKLILREHQVVGGTERERIEAAVRAAIPETLRQDILITVAPGREVVISATRLMTLRLEALLPAIRQAVAEVAEGPAPQVRLRRL